MSRGIVVAAVLAAVLWMWPQAAPVVAAPAGSTFSQDIGVNQDPVVESVDAQSAGQIEDFRVMPARKRGRIELNWSYSGRPFTGSFVGERSTNGSSWRSVGACNIAYDENNADYGCTDSNLRSGATYAYRACIVARGTACTAATATRTVSVKAP